MINHKDVMQGGLEWLALKWGKVGGTLSKGLFVESDTLMIDILSQRLEEFEPADTYENYDMLRGKELEPFAVQYLEQYTGHKFETSGWLQCEENELLGISPDGITECETIGCEIKCFARKKHTEVLLTNQIPIENIHQCIHFFTVNPKLETLYFCCYRPESVKPFIRKLTRDSLVDIGLKKKDKETRPDTKGKDKDYVIIVPDIRPVSEWVKLARKNADELLLAVNKNAELLKF